MGSVTRLLSIWVALLSSTESCALSEEERVETPKISPTRLTSTRIPLKVGGCSITTGMPSVELMVSTSAMETIVEASTSSGVRFTRVSAANVGPTCTHIDGERLQSDTWSGE